jgi:hypothetical protein
LAQFDDFHSISKLDKYYVGAVGQIQKSQHFFGFVYSFVLRNYFFGSGDPEYYVVSLPGSDFTVISAVEGRVMDASLVTGEWCACDPTCGELCEVGSELGNCKLCDKASSGCGVSGGCFENVPTDYFRNTEGVCVRSDVGNPPRPLYARWRNYDEVTTTWGTLKQPSCGSVLENYLTFDIIFDSPLELDGLNIGCGTMFNDETVG